MIDKISSEDFIKAFGGGVKHKMINISKEEIRDKMFYIREENSNQPIAVIKVSDLMKAETTPEKALMDKLRGEEE